MAQSRKRRSQVIRGLSRSTARVIGSARVAIDGAREAARSLGYVVHVLDEPVTGEGSPCGARGSSKRPREPSGQVADHRASLPPGETTVRVAGTGKGGRNQECALAMARGLVTIAANAVAASIGTDGVTAPPMPLGAPWTPQRWPARKPPTLVRPSGTSRTTTATSFWTSSAT